MNAIPTFEPISAATLGEHWFTLRLRTWKEVAKIVKASGIEQKQLAERIDMDPGQFNRVMTGKKSNVTLRTLHNIARAANHRIRITLEPLADLPRQNYSFEDALKERAKKIERQTEGSIPPDTSKWTRGTSSKVLETQA